MNRKEGYYWVIYDDNKWEIGYWDEREFWKLFEQNDWIEYHDADMDKINETQILPPDVT